MWLASSQRIMILLFDTIRRLLLRPPVEQGGCPQGWGVAAVDGTGVGWVSTHPAKLCSRCNPRNKLFGIPKAKLIPFLPEELKSHSIGTM